MSDDLAGGRETADVVIVGGGIEGLSAAWQLARRGAGRIVVVERDAIGSGGTGKSSSIVRCHYGVDTLAVMARVGLDLFEQAADILGDDVGFRPCGYLLVVAAANVAPLRANLARLQALGIDTVEVDADRVGQLHPSVRTDDIAAAAYEPRSGYGDAYRTAMAFAGAARNLGVTIRQGIAVTALRTSGDRIIGVDTTAGAIDAPVVVLAAGPWSVPLAAGVGIDLPIRAQREELVVVASAPPPRPAPVLSDLVDLQYGRVEPNGDLLVGNSDHADPEWADPDRYDNHARPDSLGRAVERIGHRFPGLADPRVRTTYAGCYDVTPDYNPIIERSRDVDGLVLCAGFSGHGFKISPAVGRLVADLVVGEHTLPDGIDPDIFRLARFATGALVRSTHPYAGAAQMR